METPDEYAGVYNNSERDLELLWEWSNRNGPPNCWATENAKVAGWIRLLLIDLEIAKSMSRDNDRVDNDGITFAQFLMARTECWEPIETLEDDDSITLSWPIFQRDGSILKISDLVNACDLDRELFAVMDRNRFVLNIPKEANCVEF